MRQIRPISKLFGNKKKGGVAKMTEIEKNPDGGLSIFNEKVQGDAPRHFKCLETQMRSGNVAILISNGGADCLSAMLDYDELGALIENLTELRQRIQ